MQYRLRTLLIALTLGPPMLAGAWWIWRRPEYAGVVVFAELCLLAVALPILVTNFDKGGWPDGPA
jgi:hypothetical protein